MKSIALDWHKILNELLLEVEDLYSMIMMNLLIIILLMIKLVSVLFTIRFFTPSLQLIQNVLKYGTQQMVSFFLCSESWQPET